MQNSIRIYYIILFLATIVGCFGFRKHTKPFKLLTIDLITTSATEAIAYYLDETLKISNTPPYHLFQIIEFMLVAAIYKNQIVNKHLKKILTYSIVIYPIIMIGFAFFLQPLKIYPSYSLMLSYSSITIYSLIYFYEFMNREDDFFMDHLFWLNILYFLLCSVSLCTLSLTNVFNIFSENNYSIYILHLTINYIFYIGCFTLLFAALIKKRRA